jgi:SAM-dependent methyltransferase
MAEQYSTSGNLASRQAIYRFRRGGAAGAFFDVVLDAAELSPDDTVADVGCGNGLYLRALARRSHRGRVVGVDLSAGMATEAATHAPTICGDAQALPVRAAAFDVALAPHMLYHVPDQAAAVRELRRIVRPGGHAVVVTNSVEHFREVDDLVAELTGARPMRSMLEFTMEDGEGVLRTAFDVVERIDWRGALDVTDVEAVVAYVASVQAWYDLPEAGYRELRQRVESVIAGDGAFVVTTATGAFVCR